VQDIHEHLEGTKYFHTERCFTAFPINCINLTLQTLDLRGAIETSSSIRLQGEIRIWTKRKSESHSQLRLTRWTDVFDQALRYPDVDWLVRTKTTDSEAVAIGSSWASTILVCLSLRLSSYHITRNYASSFMFPSRRVTRTPHRQRPEYHLSAHLVMCWQTMSFLRKQGQGQKQWLTRVPLSRAAGDQPPEMLLTSKQGMYQ